MRRVHPRDCASCSKENLYSSAVSRASLVSASTRSGTAGPLWRITHSSDRIVAGLTDWTFSAPGCPNRHKSQGRHQQVSFHDLPFAQNFQGHEFSRARYQTAPAPSNVNSLFWPEPFLAIRPGFCHCNKAAGPPAVTRALRTKVDRWNRIGLGGRSDWPLWRKTA
jgi:hypothetical protein